MGCAAAGADRAQGAPRMATSQPSSSANAHGDREERGHGAHPQRVMRGLHAALHGVDARQGGDAGGRLIVRLRERRHQPPDVALQACCVALRFIAAQPRHGWRLSYLFHISSLTALCSCALRAATMKLELVLQYAELDRRRSVVPAFLAALDWTASVQADPVPWAHCAVICHGMTRLTSASGRPQVAAHIAMAVVTEREPVDSRGAARGEWRKSCRSVP